MTKGKRKKRNWIIGGVIAAIVIGLVVAAIVLLVTKEDKKEDSLPEPNPDDRPDGSTLTLEDLLEGKVNPNSFNATWSSGMDVLLIDTIPVSCSNYNNC